MMISGPSGIDTLLFPFTLLLCDYVIDFIFFHKEKHTSFHPVMSFQHVDKTFFAKDSQQNPFHRIQPNISRIVWVYRRSQSLFHKILRIVTPNVEVYYDIPSDIDEDEYSNTKLINLLTDDDIMTEASKVKRIT